MTTIRDGHLFYAYEDEEGRMLAIDRGPEGTAKVSASARGVAPVTVAVLAEHVPEICRQLADKAGAQTTILDGRYHVDPDVEVTHCNVFKVSLDGTSVHIEPGKAGNAAPDVAREYAHVLLEWADRAEAAREAEAAQVEELALVMRRVPTGMAITTEGDYGLAVCREYARAVLGAGYRKQATS